LFQVCEFGFNLKALLINEHNNHNGKNNDNNIDIDEDNDDDTENSKRSIDMKYIIKHIIAPSNEYKAHKWEQYLYSKGPIDVEYVTRPLLMLHSWNDNFQDPFDMPIDIAKVNSNIIHCITVGGTHCLRREGLLFNKCWLAKVCLEYCNAILKNMVDINL